MRPSILGGQYKQPDQQEQNSLQNRQEQAHDPEENECPSDDQDSNALQMLLQWLDTK